MNKPVDKIIEIIMTKEIVDVKEITSFLDGIIEQLNKNVDGIYSISDSSRLIAYLSENNMLTEEEEIYLQSYYQSDDNIKRFIFQDALYDDAQLNIFKSLKSKVDKVKNDLSKVEQFDYKHLGRKFNKNNSVLLTNEEIDKVIELMEENDFSQNDILEVLKRMLLINSTIYEKNCCIDDNDKVKTEKDLIESNLDIDYVKRFFDENNIDYKVFDDDVLAKIARYADIDKMKGIIDFIKDNNIEFIFNLADIFALTLLYTSRKELEELKGTIIDNGSNLIDVIRMKPSILYPPSVEIKKHIIRKGKIKGGHNSNNISGCRNRYINNTKLLNQKGISPVKMSNKCLTFFFNSINVNMANFANLDLYGINYADKDGNLIGLFSTFSTGGTGILDGIDAAIEAKCLDYVFDCPSYIDDKSLYYMIKYANRKDNLPMEKIIINYRTDKKKSNLNRTQMKEWYKDFMISDIAYDKNKLFESYGSQVYQFADREICDNIIDLNVCNNISPLVFENEVIKKLEGFRRNMNDNYTYVFDDVHISRLKVLRYCSTLLENGRTLDYDTLMYLITKNSMLNSQEMYIISKLVKETVIMPSGIGGKNDRKY